MSTGETNAQSSEPAPTEPPSAETTSGPSIAEEAATNPERPAGAATEPSDAANENTKLARGSGPLAARGLGVAKPASPSVSTEQLEATDQAKSTQKKHKSRARKPEAKPTDSTAKPAPARPKPQKVAVPNTRGELADDIQAELDAALAAADVDSLLGGAAGMPDRKEPLADGARVHGQVLKIHQDTVYVGLGGPDEGAVPFVQFSEEPVIGSSIELIVRGINNEDGLYQCSLPGGAVEVSDWEDLDEGSVVEATVTGSNAGGLECKVGGVKGFIPISQISEYRVEDTSDFVDQKFTCVVTEASERRGNLVLSRRAILEREREEKRKQQLETLEPGVEMEGIVRSIKDFGAFVDLGGVDGLIHISKLSWDRVKHPSEVLEIGQKVKIKIDTIDKETGKLGLSYRDLLDNPWDAAEAEFAVGTVHQGTVTKIAAFGCFVRLAAGIEGLVHISELAHHRVSKVDAFVSEGQQVEVKVLSFDRDTQKISLSMKAAQQLAEQEGAKSSESEAADEPPRAPSVKPSHSGRLKGGNNRDTGGEQFGLRW